MRVLVTGSNGFVGKNLLAHLSLRADVSVLPVTRETSSAQLASAAREADFVFHLAGVNRPSDPAEYTAGNVGLTQALCDALAATKRSVPVVYSSSIQAGRDNAYGVSKLAAEQVLNEYHRSTGAAATVFRLPNIFGKWCRPNYNSVIATFCHHIGRDLPIQVNDPTATLSLVYIDDVIASFIRCMDAPLPGMTFGQVEPCYTASVGELAEQIRAFRNCRDTLVIERVGGGLTRALYATYVSYLPTDRFAYDLPKYEDPRGVFVEVLKTVDSGQFSFFTAHPGVTRGGHYHHSKTEKFLVIKGDALFKFRHLVTDERHEVRTSGDKPRIVETVPGWAHDITNVGECEMIVMLWANEIFDRAKPDTYARQV